MTTAQKAGIAVTALLGVLIIGWTIWSIISIHPIQPPPIDPKTGAADSTAIKAYGDLSAAIEARATYKIDMLVIKVLQPMFTTLITAVIGAITIKTLPAIITAVRTKDPG